MYIRRNEESASIQGSVSAATTLYDERTGLELDPTVVLRARENEKRSMHKLNIWMHCLDSDNHFGTGRALFGVT